MFTAVIEVLWPGPITTDTRRVCLRSRNTVPQGLPVARAAGLRQNVADHGAGGRAQVQRVRVESQRRENVRRFAHSTDGRSAVQIVCALGRRGRNVRQQRGQNDRRHVPQFQCLQNMSIASSIIHDLFIFRVQKEALK